MSKLLSIAYRKALRLLTVLNPKWNVKVSFKKNLGSSINIMKPRTFNEKICYLKLYDYPNNNLVVKCTDKVAVRNYLIEKGLSNILNKVYQVCERPDEIDFEKLPSKYVVKWNNDCGSSVVCKNNENKELILKKIKEFEGRKFYLNFAELHYSKIKPKIIVEKLLDDGAGLIDYKIYCFNGEPKYIMVCLNRQKHSTKFYFFDVNWNFLRINEDGKAAPQNFSIPKPKCLSEMLKYSEILSEDFKFVRNDYYIVDDKPIFGELTFSPAAGIDRGLKGNLDKLLGDLLKL